ncbi:hypothetical protein B0H66DRAFT_145300 [Apodospora peruviana]|uniref:tRNA-intron lyase n=1 Tax=Apodospora peruviana TaxID=516989 RepID=A0AAE0MB13_9PEZI|nr:hypothetical protein B0H66DRAFT_145300 [Apodospora peruviana]
MAETTTTTTMAQPIPPPSESRTGPVSINPLTMTEPGSHASAGRPPSLPRVSPHKLYALPAPIRTFPLPTFYPSNPISLVHLVCAWLSQVISPPPAEPSIIHQGVWDANTRSVHVKDPKSIRALWEQGFFGKGSLSRSEPNWLKREMSRRGDAEARVSEQYTESRREERRLLKWERAKAELEAVEKQRQEEAESNGQPPKEEIALPVTSGENLVQDQVEFNRQAPDDDGTLVGSFGESQPKDKVESDAQPPKQESALVRSFETLRLEVAKRSLDKPRPPVGPAELLALPNSLVELAYVGLTVRSPRKRPSADLSEPSPKRLCSNGSFDFPKPPVGPAELLALPNSLLDLVALSLADRRASLDTTTETSPSPDEFPSADLQPNGHGNGKLVHGDHPMNGLANGIVGHQPEASTSSEIHLSSDDAHANGAVVNGVNGFDGSVSPGSLPFSINGSAGIGSTKEKDPQPLKRRKSVRFSATVQSTIFQHHDPPSPQRCPGTPLQSASFTPDDECYVTAPIVTEAADPFCSTEPRKSVTGASLLAPTPVGELTDKEHFQLAPEEAFYLVFALGALSVVDSVTGAPIPTDELLTLFRAHSYFPPRPIDSPLTTLQPNDPFLVQYAVYHHFRSLGWVPRHGIKFGVDFILYQRGPVFDHSEFGLIVIPAFSDPLWKEHDHDTPRKSWSWLMGVNRVLAHVLKGLVLVYVDVPPPPVFDQQVRQGGIAAALKKYSIREVMVRRFSVNRNR